MSHFNDFLNTIIDARLNKIEVAFHAKIKTIDKAKMTATIEPLLRSITDKNGTEQVTTFPEIQDVKFLYVKMGDYFIRPEYKVGTVVKVIASAAPISPGYSGNYADINGQGRYALANCEIIGEILPDSFTPPTIWNSKNGLLIGKDDNTYVQIDGDNVNVEAVNGALKVNGDTRSLVTYSELDGGLQSEVTLINAELVKIAAAINAIVPGSYTPASISVNISAAETANIKTGTG